MVLNDWQRCKLPYFVVPEGYEKPLPKKQNKLPVENKVQTVTVEDDKAEDVKAQEEIETPSENAKKDTPTPSVAQNLKKIVVGLDYEPEDVKPLKKDEADLYDSDIEEVETGSQDSDDDIQEVKASSKANDVASSSDDNSDVDSEDGHMEMYKSLKKGSKGNKVTPVKTVSLAPKKTKKGELEVVALPPVKGLKRPAAYSEDDETDDEEIEDVVGAIKKQKKFEEANQ